MKRCPEVLAHFSENGLTIISFTFEFMEYKVIEQSIISQNEYQVVYEVLCTDESKIQLVLDLKSLRWGYI